MKDYKVNEYMKNDNKNVIALALVVIIAIIGFYFARPMLTGFFNTQDAKVADVNNKTAYKVKKQVEDTARSMIASYESDKLAYDEYKDSEDEEERSWAKSYKIRANKTAVSYNEYILKNKHVWADNIPADIKFELEIIK